MKNTRELWGESGLFYCDTSYPQTLESNQHQMSPHNVAGESNIKVIGIEAMINI